MLSFICIYSTVEVPYTGNVCQEESLANLMNHQRFGKLKPSKLVATIYNLLTNPFIHQTFFQNLYPSTFTNHYLYQTFLLYSVPNFKLSSMPTWSLYWIKWLCTPIRGGSRTFWEEELNLVVYLWSWGASHQAQVIV